MTEKELRELDVEVHRAVFGLRVKWFRTHFGPDAPLVPKDEGTGVMVPWYSSDMNAAWDVVRAMESGGWRLTLGRPESPGWRASFTRSRPGEWVCDLCESDLEATAAIAVCQAALAAVRSQASGPAGSVAGG